jgi:hypothetical protein
LAIAFDHRAPGEESLTSPVAMRISAAALDPGCVKTRGSM